MMGRQTTDYFDIDTSQPKSDVLIVSYADTDLGNERDVRRTVTGFVLEMKGCTNAYTSHKQRLITNKTFCSELVAAAERSTRIMWMNKYVKRLG